MLEINIRFPEKEDAEKLNADICSFFQGSKAFTNNDIIVGPVYDGWFKNKKNYFFNLTFADESIERRVTIEAGEITVMGVKKLWALAQEDREEDK